MITITKDRLNISIRDSDPQARVQCLIKALAAAMRWNARDPDKYTLDGENQYVLAQLLEELVSEG